MNGYIKLYRSLLEWDWFSDPNTLAVFMYLLLNARFVDGSWRGIPLKAGQLITGRKAISKDTGVSEDCVRRSLKRLQDNHTITIQPTNKFSLVTIENWCKYQHTDAEANQLTSSEATGTNTS